MDSTSLKSELEAAYLKSDLEAAYKSLDEAERRIKGLLVERRQNELVLGLLETGGFITEGKLDEVKSIVDRFYHLLHLQRIKPMTPEGCKKICEEYEKASDDAFWEEGHPICALAEENDSLKAALTEIEERFKGKQNLHKDDCFAYQVVRKALGTPPTEEPESCAKRK